jgi:hypothetical protein
VHRLALVALIACGRVRFGGVPGGPADSGLGNDGGSGDGPIAIDDAGHRIVTFGETGTATFSNVTTDTLLDSQHTAFNYGADAVTESAGGTIPLVGLLRFDVSALPPGQAILDATISLIPVSGNPSDAIDLYRVLEPWTEGTQTGNNGVASWTDRMLGVAWTTAGCNAPGSRDSTSLATFHPPGTPTGVAATVALDAAGVAVVQGWIANPASNAGFAIVTTGSGTPWLFPSREASQPTQRPVLTLTLP